MLEKIELNLKEICKTVKNPEDNIDICLDKGIYHNTSVYGAARMVQYDDKLLEDIKRFNKNFDEYFTFQIAYHFKIDKPTPKVIIWYSITEGGIRFFISSKANWIKPDCYFEHLYDYNEREYVFSNAEPFMYYDREKLYRVYYCNYFHNYTDKLIYDFGMFPSYRLHNVSLEDIERLEKTKNIGYSHVPMESIWEGDWKGHKLKVKRALCTII